MLEEPSNLNFSQKTGHSYLNIKPPELLVACLGATSLSELKPENLSVALREMRHMPSVMNLINAISLTPQARVLMEIAIASVALQCGGLQAFFSGSNALQDYTTDVELLGHPLPVLTNPNQQQRSRTEKVWP